MRRTFYFALLTAICAMLTLVAIPTGHSDIAYAQDGDTAPANTATHVVQPGENLFRISLRYGVTVQAIVAANPAITNPNIIRVNQSIIIPGGNNSGPGGPTPPEPPPTGGLVTYTIQRGDTLFGIARAYNTTVQAIAQQNGIANVNLIIAGREIQIPTNNAAPGPGNPGPGNPNPPPPAPGGSFELGGHVLNFGNIDEMRNAGMTWAKVQIRYERGANPDITAPAINDAHLNGFKVLLGVVGDPAEMAGMDYGAYTDEFAQFLGGVAQLGPEAIEIWNEPNLDREWPSGQVSPEAYTTMLRKGYEAIKAVNADILVISGAPAPTGFFGGCTVNGCDDIFFIQRMAAAGAAQYMDCIGAHYNEGIVSPTVSSGDPRDNYYTRYYPRMVSTYRSAFGNSVPLCWTELGYLTPEGFDVQAPPGFEWGNNNTLQEQALWLGEAVQLARSSGFVRLLIVWNVNFESASPDPSGMYGIVRPDGSCPACDTMRQALQ